MHRKKCRQTCVPCSVRGEPDAQDENTHGGAVRFGHILPAHTAAFAPQRA